MWGVVPNWVLDCAVEVQKLWVLSSQVVCGSRQIRFDTELLYDLPRFADGITFKRLLKFIIRDGG